MKETFLSIVFLVVVISIVALLCSKQRESDQQEIQKWCQTQGYSVVTCEECYFKTGPFWTKDEDQRIYKTVAQDGDHLKKILYSRSPTWIWSSWEHEWEK